MAIEGEEEDEGAEDETSDVKETCTVGDVADTTQPEEDSGGEGEEVEGDAGKQGAEAEAAPSYSPVEQPSQSGKLLFYLLVRQKKFTSQTAFFE